MVVHRIRAVGYLNIALVLCEVALVITGNIIAFQLTDTYTPLWSGRNKDKYWTFSPNLTWIVTGGLIVLQTGQLFTSFQFVQASNRYENIQTNLGTLRKDWLTWNRCLVLCLPVWCLLCEVPIFLDNKWPLVIPCGFVTLTTGMRALMAYNVKRLAGQVFPLDIQAEHIETYVVELIGQVNSDVTETSV